MFFTKRCPSGGTEYVSFELVLGILRGLGEGRGGTPGTVPVQNPEVTSRKACLRNAEITLRAEFFLRVSNCGAILVTELAVISEKKRNNRNNHCHF